MSLTSKVAKSPNICKVAIYTNGLPSAEQLNNLGSYFEIAEINSDPEDLYTTPGSIRISETSQESRRGEEYTQKLVFSLPTSDHLRAERIV